MVDKSVGTAGTLRITDDGSTVRFYVLCSDPWTNVGQYQYAINGNWYTTSLPAGFGSKLLGTRTYSSSTSVSLAQKATGTQGLGGAASLSASISRPKPNAPSNLDVTRVSDSQQTLNWTRNSTYTSVVVQRRVASGSGWSSWQQIGTASGNASTYTDKTTVANRRYEYRVAGKAASGTSAFSGTAGVATTPVAPSGVTAKRSGSNIVVNASAVSSLATSHDVRDGSTVIASSVQLPYTHVDPNPAVPHQYTVRTNRRAGSTDLTSAWSSASNTVQLVSPPNPPAGLTPNGGVAPSDEDVTFAWVHNPVDSSDQSAYELQYREPAGVWTTLAGTVDTSRDVTLPAGDVEWQVRTKGEHPDWSPWSATAVFAIIDRPGVAILSPEGSWDASILPVEWSWFQEQERPQSAWKVELVNPEFETVESRSGSGATTTFTPTTRLTEGEWTVRVQAATGDVWSEWAEQTFTVTFIPPAPPVITGEWDDSEGGVLLTISVGLSGEAFQGVDGAWYASFPGEGASNIGFDNGHPYIEDGAEEGFLYDGPNVLVSDVEPPATTSVTLERSIDGETWEPVAETDDIAALTDWESWSYGDIHYRATAFTSEGATATTEIIVEARSLHLWLSGGVGFGTTARLPFSPGVQVTAGRVRALKQYAGRSLPVAYTGEALSRVVAVSGMTEQRSEESAEVDHLVEVAQLPEDVFMFRDPDGRRIYGQIGDISLPRQMAVVDGGGFNAWWGYSFTLTETVREA